MTVRSNSGKVVFSSKSERVQQRRDNAAKRQAERDTRTDEDQVALLEERGHGLCDEAQRLIGRIRKNNG